MPDLIDAAMDLAVRAHEGQVDKAGEPYIYHCERVAEIVRHDDLCKNEDCDGAGRVVDYESGCGDPECCSYATRPCPDCEAAIAVAWLHDVAEDHPEFYEEIARTFPAEIASAVLLLDRNGPAYGTYYARINDNHIARRVKLADIRDNSDETRLDKLDPQTADRLRKKYAKAWAELGGDDGSS